MSFVPGNTAANKRDVDATTEDLEFLITTRAGTHEAAARVGFPTTDALEKWLRNHGRLDIYRRLHERDTTVTVETGFDRTIFYTRRRCTA